MNLIEKLGGYEKAKLELQLKIDGSVFQCCMSVTADMIKEALLEHRRENNIFEVGDLVLTVDQFFGEKILKIIGFRMAAQKIALFECGGFFRVSALRHATQSEIKAGHRL